MRSNKIIIYLIICFIFITGCSDSNIVEETWTIVKEKAFILSDGEYVDLWRSDFGWVDTYKLTDGTSILAVEEPKGPTNVHVIGRESLDDLGENAQNAILAYYEKQGLLYDIQSELEKAYTEYLRCKNRSEEFRSHFINQAIVPTASNENIICFLTSVKLPVSGRLVKEIQSGAVFNRDTGEKIDTMDLFTMPENKVFNKLLDLSQISEVDLLVEMERVFKSEYIVFLKDNLTVSFPQGTLSDKDYGVGFGIDYDDLKDVLHNWAIPSYTEVSGDS